MLILHNDCNEKNIQINSIVVVFGVGLIGTHLIQALNKYSYKVAYNLPFSWDEGQVRRSIENSLVCQCILGLLKAKANAKAPETSSPKCIDFVWSAGKGGFSMQGSETVLEIASFSNILTLANIVARECHSCVVRFHMLSSAGGLFEGQLNVGKNTVPNAKRPYAAMKLKQEQILNSCSDMVQFIYRPTSVYGFAGLNHRMGLIPTLLYNGSKNKASSIFGTPDTLRDYVYANDIGSFIADRIISKTTKSESHILASGKPSALFEIHRRIEKILNKKFFCHYIKDGENTENSTFSSATYPAGWSPLCIETGFRKTYNILFSDFTPPSTTINKINKNLMIANQTIEV